jgi:hypothetical protein
MRLKRLMDERDFFKRKAEEAEALQRALEELRKSQQTEELKVTPRRLCVRACASACACE